MERDSIEIRGQSCELFERNAVTVRLGGPENARFIYTTDGSAPQRGGTLYKGPVTLSPRRPYLTTPEILSKTTVELYRLNPQTKPSAVIVRAAIKNSQPSVGSYPQDAARTFFPAAASAHLPKNVPVLSLIADPKDLLNDTSGILCKGRLYDQWLKSDKAQKILADKTYWLVEANYTQKGRAWEKPAHLDYFEGDLNKPLFSLDLGLRLHGEASRHYVLKPFNLYFRKAYGSPSLTYPVFQGLTDALSGRHIHSHKSLTLANGGDSLILIKYREPLLMELARQAGLRSAVLAERPSVLFLNGEFYGVFLIKEKLSRSYFSEHFGVDKKTVALCKEGTLRKGTDADQKALETYKSFAAMDMTDPGVWDSFCQAIDLDSYIDVCAYEIAIANDDWSDTKNTFMWRTNMPAPGLTFADGRWRFALYDLECSSGAYGHDATSPDADSYTSAKKNLSVFRSACRSAAFKEMLADRIEGLLPYLEPTLMQQKIDFQKKLYRPLMRLADRLPAHKPVMTRCKYGHVHIDEYRLRDFFERRAAYLKNKLIPLIRSDST